MTGSQASRVQRERRREIERYVERLGEFGVSLTELTRRCPKRPETRRTVRAVAAVLASDPKLYGDLLARHTLPADALTRYVPMARRLLRRHRPYIIALALASGGEFPHLRAYLRP